MAMLRLSANPTSGVAMLHSSEVFVSRRVVPDGPGLGAGFAYNGACRPGGHY